ncbi:MAG: serine--tRNA ligase [Bacteroidetes bacterium]|nr:serine--tRNA ligase [Rhodothermia bacterium]MCS7155970.1 serine--tRNA ligase [Bacteroidota bacterium]MCX7907658.1 serine--tRNA ligase [Bacteroidota bacterium]MDW8137787.1 serine--tRNA ligase [Bacteroidota bacterium]MDW8286362.1 serine--tRNA ligase [Bacteroidota bacterium]
MIDIRLLRQDPERIRQAVLLKQAGDPALVDQILRLDEERRRLQAEADRLRAELNALSRQIGQLMGQSRQEEASAIKTQTAELKYCIRQLEERLQAIESEQEALLLQIPNPPHPSVPVGRSASDNQVVRIWGDPRPSEGLRPHWEIAEALGIIDFARGAKVSGSGFPFYVGMGARLQRALIAFFLDEAARRGYLEMEPPLLVNASSARGTGQLPDKEDLMYVIERDELYLVPTAEVPLTNYYRDELLEEDALPIRLCAYTPCFRREAGSYGRDVRGLNRLHQFDKVELVRIAHPEQSYAELESLREDAERLLQLLGLPYRVLLMCTADLGFTPAKKYDLEVWSPAQSRWLEVSSVSNFEDFQARRMNLRFRPRDGSRPRLVHTLNGSGLALPRVVAALLEHYQTREGRVRVPEVLVPYLNAEWLSI